MDGSPPAAKPATSATDFPRTFYRRRLPPDTCVSFSSPEGRAVFASASAGGGVHSFFPLVEQLQTQPEPAYCGLTTLVIVLNALAVDPRRSWKGPWRWYEESMLNCCVDIEEVKKTGVTFGTVACLAKCQGLNVDAVYGQNSTVEEFRRVVKRTCTSPPSVEARSTSFLIVSYTRKVIGQTGTGHFSPIGAYDEASDRVLVLDTARFKYGPHWVSLPLMFEALLPLDPATGKSRGYMVLGYDGAENGDGAGAEDEERLSQLPLSVVFGSKKSKDYLRREYKQYLEGANNSGKDVTLASVIDFWTEGGTNNKRVWELVERQLQPVDAGAITMLESLRSLIKNLVLADAQSSSFPPSMLLTESGTFLMGQCCGSTPRNNERKVEISPAEVLYIIYLASLSPDARRGIIYQKDPEGEGMAIEAEDASREQLLAEAALISYAIETCDYDP